MSAGFSNPQTLTIMRVAHICTRFNRLSETFVYDLIVGLERSGTENHILTAARENAEERPFARVQVLTIPLWHQAVFAIQKRWMRTYRFPLPLRATRRAIQHIRPDVILAHFGGTGAAIAPVAREQGIPLIVVFHAFDLFMRHFRPATYAALWGSGVHSVAVSEHGRRRLLELGCPEDRVRVIHCGVDVTRFAPVPARRPDATGFRLVGIGRFVEKKGFDDLLRAVAGMRHGLAGPLRLDLWGEGPLKPELEALTRRLDLQKVVTFKGGVSHTLVPELLSRYDAFVLPSKTARNGDTEGIPISILEAQAAALPVVATLHAGIPEGVPPGNRDWLAREGDIDDLEQKLRMLASQRTRWQEIGLRGRRWVLKHFRLEQEIHAYRCLFAEIKTPCP